MEYDLVSHLHRPERGSHILPIGLYYMVIFGPFGVQDVVEHGNLLDPHYCKSASPREVPCKSLSSTNLGA